MKFCQFPFWVHPWWEKRGQHTYYPVGETTMEAALAYDAVYSLMSEAERKRKFLAGKFDSVFLNGLSEHLVNVPNVISKIK